MEEGTEAHYSDAELDQYIADLQVELRQTRLLLNGLRVSFVEVVKHMTLVTLQVDVMRQKMMDLELIDEKEMIEEMEKRGKEGLAAVIQMQKILEEETGLTTDR